MDKIISNIKKELEQLKKSKLINDFVLDTQIRNDPKIQITTLENEKLDIELGDNYCYKVLKNQKLYESFESLLNKFSPLYTKTFWERVTSGLNNKEGNSDDDNYNYEEDE